METVPPRITAQQVADEIGADSTHPRIARLITVYDTVITQVLASTSATVPPAIAAEAVLRLVAYAFDTQIGPGSTWSNILLNSGALSLLACLLYTSPSPRD